MLCVDPSSNGIPRKISTGSSTAHVDTVVPAGRCEFFVSRSTATTDQPAFANASAIPDPIPFAAPVTTTLLMLRAS